MATDKPDDVAVAARFAHLATVLSYLQEMLDIHVKAEDMYTSLRRDSRARIDENSEDKVMNVVYALARTDPAQRRAEQGRVEEAVRNLTDVIEDPDFLPMMRFDRDDLQVILRFIDAIELVGDRSRLELIRFFDGLRANDVGYLVALSVPARGDHGSKRLEMRFANELPADTRKALSFPTPPNQQRGNREPGNDN